MCMPSFKIQLKTREKYSSETERKIKKFRIFVVSLPLRKMKYNVIPAKINVFLHILNLLVHIKDRALKIYACIHYLPTSELQAVSCV